MLSVVLSSLKGGKNSRQHFWNLSVQKSGLFIEVVAKGEPLGGVIIRALGTRRFFHNTQSYELSYLSLIIIIILSVPISCHLLLVLNARFCVRQGSLNTELKLKDWAQLEVIIPVFNSTLWVSFFALCAWHSFLDSSICPVHWRFHFRSKFLEYVCNLLL